MDGIITKILPRRNFLPRPPVANIDLVIFVSTIKKPNIDLETYDRFILSAEFNGFTPLIVINKIDVIKSKKDINLLDRINKIYTSIGYDTLNISALSQKNLKKFETKIINKTSILAGPSGVGKSTILSKLIKDREFVTGELSKNTGRGTHTTTSTTLIPLSNGGFVADTPGFAFFDIPNILQYDLSQYFPEFEKYSAFCKFNNCQHNNEPGCEIKNCVENGIISENRYKNYLKFYNHLENKWKRYPNLKPQSKIRK